MARLNVSKLIKSTNLAPTGDWGRLLQEMEGQDDRVVAILGATFLDNQLKATIQDFLVDDEKIVEDMFSTDKPLSSFSARIKVAYALGLIHKDVFNDLNTIRDIRNVFAHALYGVSFKHSDIIKACYSLSIPKQAIPFIKDEPDPRATFTIAIAMIASYLLVKNSVIKKQRRKHPDDISIIRWKSGDPDLDE